MSRPSRRVRQRLAKRLAVSRETVKAAEQARKERQSIGRIKSVLLENYGRLTNTSARLSVDNLSQMAYSAPGLYDGKLTIRGPFVSQMINGELITSFVKGAKRSKWGKPKFVGTLTTDWMRRERAIAVLGILILLEACYNGETDRADWLLEIGPKVLNQFAPLFTITLAGDNRSRSVRAQNAGSGKPIRKPKVIQPLGQKINKFVRNQVGKTVSILPEKGSYTWVLRNGQWVPKSIVFEGKAIPEGEKPPKGFKTLHDNASGAVFIKPKKT